MSVRCYECIHWKKGLATERLGECRAELPQVSYGSRMGLWPVTRSSDSCGRFQDAGVLGREAQVINLDDLVMRAFEKFDKKGKK